MKKINYRLWMLCYSVTIILFLFSTLCFAGRVRGYFRSDGTYVQSYYRTDPNETVTDNYSYKGNYNPYTGKIGTNYYRHSPSSEYYNSYSVSQSSSDTTRENSCFSSNQGAYQSWNTTDRNQYRKKLYFNSDE